MIAFLMIFGCKPYDKKDVYNEAAVVETDELVHEKNSLEWWYFTGHLKEKNGEFAEMDIEEIIAELVLAKEKYKEIYGDDIPVNKHPEIRSVEACYKSTERVIALAKKTGARLHVFHISTAKELNLFTNKIPLEEKQITAEVCIHHLWFTDADYETKGSLIKWNPAVKTQADKDALWKALLDGRIDVVATDHAPHTLEEKSNNE